MSRRLRQIIAGWVMALALAAAVPLGGMTAMASSAKISFSDPSATVGNQVTVNVKVTATDGALGGADIMLSYDPAMLEFVGGANANGGAGSIKLLGTMDSDNTTAFSYSLTFKTLQAGDTGISVASYEVYDKDTQPMTMTHVGSSSVKVKPLATYSSEAALSSLEVSPGALSPAFSPDVTEYSVNVGGDVDKIAVSANPKDGKAKVVINGSSGLKVGDNTVVCKVTAEDGQTVKSYTIHVTKAEAPLETGTEGSGEAPVTGDLTVSVGDQQYSVAVSFDETTLPEGFEASTVSYNGTEIMAGKGIEKPLTLIYLAAADGSGAFYIYDEASGSVSPYVTLHVTEKTIVILEPDDQVEIPDGFTESTVELEGQKVTGWVWSTDTEQRYCVFYGMNWNGEKGLYRYDIGEKTIQRYFEDPQAAGTYTQEQYVEVAEQYNSLLEDYDLRFKVIIGLAVLCLIFLFLLINTILRHRDSGYDRRLSEDRRQERAPKMTKAQKTVGGSRLETHEAGRSNPQDDDGDDDFDFVELDDLDLGDAGRGGETADAGRDRSEAKKAASKNSKKDDDDFEFIDLD